MEENTPQQSNASPSSGGMDGKTIAIISYITLIGLIVAFVMNQNKKDDLASYHIRQMVGLTLLSIALSILGWILGSVSGMLGMVVNILSLGVLVLWVLGLIKAIGGEKSPVPIVGQMFQDWFKNIG